MLKGERVVLRALEPQDAAQLYRWHLDHEFSVLDGVTHPTSRTDWDEFVETAARRSNESITLAIQIEPELLVGYTALKRIRSQDRSAEFGIAISREYWNQGFGSDATLTLLRFAFTELNLHRVSLTVADYNERARRMYESCGFREEGRLREARFRAGSYCDNVIMGILEHEFLRSDN